jgi:uncharacterized protein with NRDE domain
MCTVTIVPYRSGFILTSSRDENPHRETIPPDLGMFLKAGILYPMDQLGGGSWIGSTISGNVSCILNGAFRNHKKKSSYKKSRGKILIDAITSECRSCMLDNIDLEEIEPFTMINLSMDGKESFEFRWDGRKKYKQELERTRNYIWSSATLYDSNTAAIRAELFENWISKDGITISPEMLFEFHNSRHMNDPENDILMHRSSTLSTVSITQITITKERRHMVYYDRSNKNLHLQNF